ncbi:hypothetical protein AGDE_02265 [Angomonas deanei]|nr:hypothetical protein AGDE_02265 [Angomonas deanei]|eukprot:EPY41659.1 hypothetical protein AGDE_02265 [Angomonas deanei]
MSVSNSQKAPAASPAEGNNSGMGGNPFAGNPDAMAQMLKYLPTIMKVAAQTPGVVFGFVATIFYVLVILGRTSFRENVAAVSGFHLLVFFCLREVYQPCVDAYHRIKEAQLRKQKQKRFASDIGMQYRQTLD